jgi:predicted Zn-dependent protease
MNLFRTYILFIILSLTSLTLYSCSGGGINLFSKQDDVELGKQVVDEMSANPQEYPPFKGDPSIKTYIDQRIFQHIMASSKIAGKDVYPYQIEILDKPDELNAFALPGGYLYVYTGLLKYLDSEAALAGVLGHEIAHAALRHATNRMTAYYGVSMLASLILGENPSQLAEIAANLFTGLAFLANSRSDENQADEYSFQYLQDTRYYPGGVKFFFEKMRDDGLVSSKSDKIATFLSTHPDPIDRISNTETRLRNAGLEIKTYTATGDGIFKDEYQANIKGKIK